MSEADFNVFVLKALQDKRYQFIIQQQAEKIQEMAAIMEKAALLDEDKDLKFEQAVGQLQTENKVTELYSNKSFTITIPV